MKLLSPTRTIALGLTLAVAALVAPAGAAAAVETYKPRYDFCGTNRGGGATDKYGVMYAACGTKIVRFSATGARMTPITIKGLTFISVAPAPGGKVLYVSRGADQRAQKLKLVRGVWKVDPAWKLGQFTLGGRLYTPVARDIKTDEFGNIYVSNAGTDPDTKQISPNRILKYARNGTIMTAFGRYGNEGDTAPDSFRLNRGLAVSRDGRNLFVTSHLHGQVRRFDLQADGSYRHGLTFGFDYSKTCSDGTGGGTGLAAPSDVAVDPWGFVYIADTTCRKIKRYNPDGTLAQIIAATGPKTLHSIGVNRRGDVFAGEWNRYFKRTSAVPPIPAITQPVIDAGEPDDGGGDDVPVDNGGADATAPVINGLTMPTTTKEATITIAIDATDNVGVTRMRLANENGVWGPWMNFATPHVHTLSAPNNLHRGVSVQVKDAAGNLSKSVYTVVRWG